MGGWIIWAPQDGALNIGRETEMIMREQPYLSLSDLCRIECSSRQHIIQQFNRGVFDYLIATGAQAWYLEFKIV